MSFPASFVKLADDTWGVRVPKDQVGAPLEPGATLMIATRSGQKREVTLARPMGFNRYGDSLWSLAPQAAAPQATAQVGSLDGVLALFAKAKTHLKRPAIVLAVPGLEPDPLTEDRLGRVTSALAGTVRLTIAGDKAKVPGSITVTTGEFTTTNDYGEPAREWLGRVTVDGEYQPSRAANGRTDAIAQRLAELAREPAKVAADSGRLTGRCCFCNRALSDERSTAVGYGQTCANHFGVAWGARPEGFAEQA